MAVVCKAEGRKPLGVRALPHRHVVVVAEIKVGKAQYERVCLGCGLEESVWTQHEGVEVDGCGGICGVVEVQRVAVLRHQRERPPQVGVVLLLHVDEGRLATRVGDFDLQPVQPVGLLVVDGHPADGVRVGAFNDGVGPDHSGGDQRARRHAQVQQRAVGQPSGCGRRLRQEGAVHVPDDGLEWVAELQAPAHGNVVVRDARHERGARARVLRGPAALAARAPRDQGGHVEVHHLHVAHDQAVVAGKDHALRRLHRGGGHQARVADDDGSVQHGRVRAKREQVLDFNACLDVVCRENIAEHQPAVVGALQPSAHVAVRVEVAVHRLHGGGAPVARVLAGDVAVKDAQAVAPVGMCRVVGKGEQGRALRTHGGGAGGARRMHRQVHPETVPLRSRGGIALDGVVGVGDPERCGCGVRVQQRVRRARQHSKVVAQDVLCFNAVLNEERVAHDVVRHIPLHAQVGHAVDGHGAVEGVVDGRIADVGRAHVAQQMVVDGVAPEPEGLANVARLNVLDATHRLAVRVVQHDVRAQLVCLCVHVVSLENDVARQKAHLCTHVHHLGVARVSGPAAKVVG
mmetsp:Transcript_4311/g.10608  ORF Transcript_4311/g.10608 Transcript_4311/m.10608 type:complete len:573 (+) Transcript_4311:4183-5901(+)